ncbi:O-fucosyltransferase 23 [Magnolia sinica]|uniref:O-fucosyltransferase 23 n=1 Tax=Magnolia sinica TaxID=86752 RepID=UPI002659B134|nr:O-fucosyltransferase 23 [Magnolia sinica]XP_058072014.1 O-fucosyltransferase 23 [Magnolia sinica]XP_058072015.1 O-fucosyltransferase 23 [Magnolia sinica]XP_058072016.1 O-fucosyltransferase 23 [Magnolia sinica]XP_058072017.1 O-fucosyltransferase 23 [Magnolia sinica]
MASMRGKRFQFLGFYKNTIACRCLSLVFVVLLFSAAFLSSTPGFSSLQANHFDGIYNSSVSNSAFVVRKDKFLEVPQIVWGLNNQKIAFVRACLTARMLNRTLLMPSLSASLFYKEIELLEPIAFDKIFQFEQFNSICNGFVRLGQFSDLSNPTGPFELLKGSGRKWTVERDLDQLKQCREDPAIDDFEVIRIVGKNPFLWHDHWPVKDYAKIFKCLVLVDEIANEATKVVSKIREVGGNLRTDAVQINNAPLTPYIAVHMRIEKDWMIHCKKLEQRSKINQICSSKEEIMERVAHIVNLSKPIVIYLAIADSLLEDASVLNGWKEGLLPFEKKKLGVWDIYKKHPYLIQSAIDYEVCLRADVFVGNSFSTFSSLIVLERTQKLIEMGITRSCGLDVRWPSYAYNILGDLGGPQRWMTAMSDSSLHAISYGSNNISC